MKSWRQQYEQIRPQIVWLGFIELIWLGYWLSSSATKSVGFIISVVVWLIAMLVWLFCVTILARKGYYLKRSAKFSNLIGFFGLIFFSIAVFGSTEAGRVGIQAALEQTSNTQLVLFHTLRILSIGTLIKYLQGQLPRHFLIFGTLPDLLFALSAVCLIVMDNTFLPSREFYIAWHTIGITVFFGAGVAMFLSVPSPIRIYQDLPDTKIVFKYPMALAPNFTVPLFALGHVFALTILF